MTQLEDILKLHPEKACKVAQQLFTLSTSVMSSLRGKVSPYALQVFCDEAQLCINNLRATSGKEGKAKPDAVPLSREPL